MNGTAKGQTERWRKEERGNDAPGSINHDGHADVSTEDHPGRLRHPSIKRSKIRDVPVRTSELLLFSIFSGRLSSSSLADVLDADPQMNGPPLTQTDRPPQTTFFSIHRS